MPTELETKIAKVSFNGAGIIKIRFVNSEQRSLHESAVRLA
jgi:hypothetical protein